MASDIGFKPTADKLRGVLRIIGFMRRSVNDPYTPHGAMSLTLCDSLASNQARKQTNSEVSLLKSVMGSAHLSERITPSS